MSICLPWVDGFYRPTPHPWTVRTTKQFLVLHFYFQRSISVQCSISSPKIDQIPNLIIFYFGKNWVKKETFLKKITKYNLMPKSYFWPKFGMFLDDCMVISLKIIAGAVFLEFFDAYLNEQYWNSCIELLLELDVPDLSVRL